MLDVSSLPWHERQGLLDLLRTRLGHREFERLVNELGEDGLLSAVFQSAAEGHSARSEPAPEVPAALAWIACAVFKCYLWVMGAGFWLGPFVLSELNAATWKAKAMGGLLVAAMYWVFVVLAAKESTSRRDGIDWKWALHLLYGLGTAIAGIVYVVWGLAQAAS